MSHRFLQSSARRLVQSALQRSTQSQSGSIIKRQAATHLLSNSFTTSSSHIFTIAVGAPILIDSMIETSSNQQQSQGQSQSQQQSSSSSSIIPLIASGAQPNSTSFATIMQAVVDDDGC